MAQKDQHNTFYITHSGELLIWLIIALIVISISTTTFISNEKTNNDYNIFMPDVDGLIVGSPVRMMGIEVGHVTKIKPTHNEVYVKFLLDDRKMHLPQGTVATVEFSGMAGSKSLELYLPDKNTYTDSDTPILIVNPPKRLHDALGLLNDMFNKIGTIIYTSSSFGEKVKDIDLQTGSTQNMGEFLELSNKMIDGANKRAEDLGNKVNGVKNIWK